MREAIREAATGLRSDSGGPFGCVSVREGAIVARGNKRDACRALARFALEDCALYASSEPCPMCLAAIYWARIPRVFYGNTRADAAAIGFDDAFIYREMPLPPGQRAIEMRQLLPEEALATFREWQLKPDRRPY